MTFESFFDTFNSLEKLNHSNERQRRLKELANEVKYLEPILNNLQTRVGKLKDELKNESELHDQCRKQLVKERLKRELVRKELQELYVLISDSKTEDSLSKLLSLLEVVG